MNETKKGNKGDLKPQHKKTPDRTTMGPTTDIYSQAPTLWNRLRRGHHLVWGPTHRRAIKVGNKVSFLLILYWPSHSKTCFRAYAQSDQLLPANRIIGHYRLYQRRANARMSFCACGEWIWTYAFCACVMKLFSSSRNHAFIILTLINPIFM